MAGQVLRILHETVVCKNNVHVRKVIVWPMTFLADVIIVIIILLFSSLALQIHTLEMQSYIFQLMLEDSRKYSIFLT